MVANNEDHNNNGDDDGSSVNLLMMSSEDEDDEDEENTTELVVYSPATQTLNSLSQGNCAMDLRADHLSQLDLDVAATLLSVRNDTTMRMSPDRRTAAEQLHTLSIGRGSPIQRQQRLALPPPQDTITTTTAKRISFASSRASDDTKGTTRKKPSNEAASQKKKKTSPAREFYQLTASGNTVVGRFSTVAEASRVSGCNRGTITRILRGDVAQWKGYTFEYLEDDDADDAGDQRTTPSSTLPHNDDVATLVSARDVNSMVEKVCLVTGKVLEVFPTYTAAGRAIQCDRRVIAKVVAGKIATPFPGFTFRIVQGPPPPPVSRKRPHKSVSAKSTPVVAATGSRSIPILQIDAATNTVVATHSSILVASQKTKVNRHKIYAVLRGEMEHWDGTIWRYQQQQQPSDPHRPQKKMRMISSAAATTAVTSTSPTRPSTIVTTKPSTQPTGSSSSSSRRRRHAPTQRHSLPPPRRLAASSSSVTSSKSHRAIPIEQLDATTGCRVAIHGSISVAAESAGVNRHKVYAVLQGKMPDYNGMVWRYCTASTTILALEDGEQEPTAAEATVESENPSSDTIVGHDARVNNHNTTQDTELVVPFGAGTTVDTTEPYATEPYVGAAGDGGTSTLRQFQDPTQGKTTHDVAKDGAKRSSVNSEQRFRGVGSEHGDDGWHDASQETAVMDFDHDDDSQTLSLGDLSSLRKKSQTNLYKSVDGTQGRSLPGGDDTQEAPNTMELSPPTTTVDVAADTNTLSTNPVKKKRFITANNVVPRESSKTVASKTSSEAPTKSSQVNDSQLSHSTTRNLKDPPKNSSRNAAIPIEQVNPDGHVIATYSSILTASKKYGINRSRLRALLKSGEEGSDGMRWRYCCQEEQSQKSTIDSMRQAEQPEVPIEEIDVRNGRLITVHTSFQQAAEQHDIGVAIVTSVLQGHVDSWNGISWRYQTKSTQSGPTGGVDPLEASARGAVDGSVGFSKQTQDEWVSGSNDAFEGETENLNRRNVREPAESLQKTKKKSSVSIRKNGPTSIPTSLPNNKKPKSFTAYKPEIPQSSTADEDYAIFKVTIEDAGPLRLKVSEGKAPTEVLKLLYRDHGVDLFSGNSMYVSSRKKGCVDSPAIRAGIQLNDWLFLLDENTGDVELQYNTVRDGVAKGSRPLSLLVGRLKSEAGSAILKAAEEQVGTDRSLARQSQGTPSDGALTGKSTSRAMKTTDVSAANDSKLKKTSISPKIRQVPALKPQAPIATLTGAGPAKSRSTLGSIMPFCPSCNPRSGKPSVHHAWCPKSANFEKSGADVILKRILRGLETGCGACQLEYKSGRKTKERHTGRCQQNRSKLNMKKKRSTANEKVHGEAFDDLSLVDDEEGSVFDDQSKRNVVHKLHFLPNPPKNGGSGEVTVSHPAKPTKQPKKKTAAVLKDKNVVPGKSSTGTSKNPPAAKEDNCIVSWEPCPNPWGDDDLLPTDEIVFTSFKKPKRSRIPLRYSTNPFASDHYKGSHHSPESGCEVVVLHRDPMCRAPWGFLYERHEFGGACIITSVDDKSPSTRAVSGSTRLFLHVSYIVDQHRVGMPQTSTKALSQNDIILVINGNSVGGMTEDRFAVELETCGSKLLLVVAPYRFSKRILKEMESLERKEWEDLDTLLNDERELGWVDFEKIGSIEDLPVEQHPVTEQLLPVSTRDVTKGSNGNEEEISSGFDFPSSFAKDAFTNSALAENEASIDLPSDLKQGSKDSPVPTLKWQGSSSQPIDESNVDQESRHHVLLRDGEQKQAARRSIGIDIDNMSVVGTVDHDGNHIIDTTGVDNGDEDDNGSIETMGDGKVDHNDKDIVETVGVGNFKEENGSIDSAGIGEVDNDDDDSKGTLSTGEDDNEDDSNAWCDCICGVRHTAKNIFWIQCDGCDSWYEVSPSCVGFDASKVKSVATWMCLGCGGTHSPTAQIESDTEENGDGAIPSEADEQKNPAGPRFKKDDFVFIKEHAWPGVNNPEGIACVLDTYLDEDDDIVYDVQYIVGRSKKKAVLEEYLEEHHFS